MLKTRYTSSRALVIGINDYKNAPRLSYAVSDAKEFRAVLTSDFGFSKEHVSYLENTQATRETILREFMRFTRDDVELDERIIVFFAGHGHTQSGIRGEVGFLVPHDADLDDLSTLIRWHELTQTADLIRAKHMLFIMDACYGGLALNRNFQPGSTRFLKDMMLRYSRQVLAAGKANEVVADSGGPLPNHSVFTGHLLEGLRGKAEMAQGVLTANGLMSYVHNKVAMDKNSNQTPHHGYFDGDGDLILNAPNLNCLEENNEKDIDNLVAIPFPDEEPLTDSTSDKVKHVKTILTDESRSIDLHDFMIEEVRRFLAATNEDDFKVSGQFSGEELLERISKYEEASGSLSILTACLTYWYKPDHKSILQKIVARSTDRLESQGGLKLWLALRWYPIILNLYTAGIAAVEAQRYDSIATIFYTPIASKHYNLTDQILIEAVSTALSEFALFDIFKKLPGYERYRTPLSEYLFKILQPRLDDTLFIGRSYEKSFDEFEMILALVTMHRKKMKNENIWVPVGRFGWKRARHNPPLAQLIQTAQMKGHQWEPFRSGLFDGAINFKAIGDELQQLISKMRFG